MFRQYILYWLYTKEPQTKGFKLNNEPLKIDHYRNRKLRSGYRPCPEEYLLKLELKNIP